MSTTEDVKELTVWQLARMADCVTPDRTDSPGGDWLDTVRRDALDTFDADDPDQETSESADSLVPIYTATVWAVFVDLGAYQEDVTEFGPIEDMEQAAKVALYMIADRLISAIWSDLREDAEDDDSEGDES